MLLCLLVGATLFSCASKKNQNVITWKYKQVVSAKKVTPAQVYTTVRDVLNQENIPNFTTQQKNKYDIETEWLVVRRGGQGYMDMTYPTPPNSLVYPSFIKFYVSITKKSYTLSAVTTNGGVTWVSYDLSYKPNATLDVLKNSDYWSNMVYLTRQINVNLKSSVDGMRFSSITTTPNTGRPFYSGNPRPTDSTSWPYPDRGPAAQSMVPPNTGYPAYPQAGSIDSYTYPLPEPYTGGASPSGYGSSSYYLPSQTAVTYPAPASGAYQSVPAWSAPQQYATPQAAPPRSVYGGSSGYSAPSGAYGYGGQSAYSGPAPQMYASPPGNNYLPGQAGGDPMSVYGNAAPQQQPQNYDPNLNSGYYQGYQPYSNVYPRY
jgi:hypothetical protein